MLRLVAIGVVASMAMVSGASAQQLLAERGAYLVNGNGGCNNCHTPDNPEKMKRLVLLQTPAHAAAEIKRVMAAVRDNRMPRDEIGIEKELDAETKTLLLKYGATFESTVNAAYAWERRD